MALGFTVAFGEMKDKCGPDICTAKPSIVIFRWCDELRVDELFIFKTL
jgi:hypothetical protein